MDTPNVVWITLDSVRTDHVTPGGATRNTTPNLQQIVDEPNGFYHEQCIAHARWSLPSISSILTGTYPSYHQTGFDNKVLVSEVPTAAELFSEVGYTTACLSRNPHLSHETNLNRGFDRFEYIQASTLLQSAGLKTTTKFLANLRRHSAGLEFDKYAHSTPYVVNDMANRWVRDFTKQTGPFFFYLHYNEPHTPYYPPLPYLDEFSDDFEMEPRNAARRVLEICENKDRHIATGFSELTGEDWNILNAMYDAEIKYTDKMVGKLIKNIKEKSDRHTIFVITADHGELFGEYGIFGHSVVLHDGLIRVPLVTSGLDVEKHLVQHADILQTIGEIAGINTESMQGIDLRQESREFAVAQTSPSNLDQYQKYNPNFGNEHYIQRTQSDVLRTEKFKYRAGDDREWLFELPDQESNIIESNPQVAADFRGKREEWYNQQGSISERADTEYSEEMKQQLKDLGYHE